MIDRGIQRLSLARTLSEQGEYIKALKLANEPLADNPASVPWLMLTIYCLEKADQLPIAYHLCKRLLEIAPRDPSVWLNMVNIESRLWMTTAAIKSAKRGLELAKDPFDRIRLLMNMGCIYVDTGQFDEGERVLKQALAVEGCSEESRKKILGNLGFCQLAHREWAEGWKSYHNSLGQWREKIQYANEPEWDGTPGKKVVLYGEQGIGDQICFASVLEDASKHNELIVDTHPKLKNLFARSFPFVRVYGTRHEEARVWRKEDRQFDASFPLGQLGEFFRLKDEDYPRKPFLVPDSERVLMWRSLFASKKKPVIGIAWTGGIQRTGRRFRLSTLEDWIPLFRAIDAHWVSLEYKPSKDIDEFKAAHPDIDIKEYPHATLTDDYDDTAALVAALDLVVTVPTSVGHLAGALGTKIIWLKHAYPCFKVAAGMPFHPVDHLIDWRGTWKATVQDAIGAARSTLGMIAASPSLTTACGTPSSPMPVSRSA